MSIQSNFANFAKKNAFNLAISHNFDKPNKSNSNFPFCCGMFYPEGYESAEHNLGKEARSQWSIRGDNAYRAGISEKHLTFFTMLGLFDYAMEDLSSSLETTVKYLRSLVDTNKLTITASSVLPPEIITQLRDYNLDVNATQEVPWETKLNTPFTGNRIEFHYKSDNISMEIWNLSFLNREGTYQVMDGGGCLERLETAHEEKDSVFDSKSFQEWSRRYDTNRNKLFSSRQEDNYFLDISRTTYHLSKEFCEGTLSRKQKYHARKIFKDFLLFSEITDVPEEYIKSSFFTESHFDTEKGYFSTEKRKLESNPIVSSSSTFQLSLDERERLVKGTLKEIQHLPFCLEGRLNNV